MRWSRVCCSSRESPGLASRCTSIRWGCCGRCLGCAVISSAGATDAVINVRLLGCYVYTTVKLKMSVLTAGRPHPAAVRSENTQMKAKLYKHLSPPCGGGSVNDPASAGNHGNPKTNICHPKTPSKSAVAAHKVARGRLQIVKPSYFNASFRTVSPGNRRAVAIVCNELVGVSPQLTQKFRLTPQFPLQNPRFHPRFSPSTPLLGT